MNHYTTDSGIFMTHSKGDMRHICFVFHHHSFEANIIHRDFYLDFHNGFFEIICDAGFFTVRIPFDEAEFNGFIHFADYVAWDSITVPARRNLEVLRG